MNFRLSGGGTGTVNQAMLQHFARITGLEIDLVTSALGKAFEEESFSNEIKLYEFPFAIKIFIIRRTEN